MEREKKMRNQNEQIACLHSSGGDYIRPH